MASAGRLRFQAQNRENPPHHCVRPVHWKPQDQRYDRPPLVVLLHELPPAVSTDQDLEQAMSDQLVQ
jgi:hypothetical protein